MSDAFLHGKNEEHLKHIDSNISDIKNGMKEHNVEDRIDFERIHERISEVSEASQESAKAAYGISSKIREREEAMTAQFNDLKEDNARLEKKMDEFSKELKKISTKVTNIYAFATGISFAAALAATWLKDKILGKG